MPARRRLPILRLAGKAPYRVTPVTSTLGLTNAILIVRARMNITPEWVSAIASVASAAFTGVAAGAVVYAHKQLKTSRQISQLQFEDGLAKEYRELANKLPTKALLGEDLSEDEYQDAFDELFHYVDLSNEQVCLRERNRVGGEAWRNWADGIETNLSLPAFNRAWSEIKVRSKSFKELRRLEAEKFKLDPVDWKAGEA